MIILPAIDIRGGKAVRLYQGDYTKEEVVAKDIYEQAKEFQKLGATHLHLVDLDGAKQGAGINEEIILKLAKTVDMSIEVGGGIRTLDRIDKLLGNGIDKVILGTAAMEQEDLVKAALAKYAERIIVGVDARNGKVCGNGWLSESDLDYIDFTKKMADLGVDNVIVTDISRDGTLQGANIEMLKTLSEKVDIKITASGGVKDIEDIKKLKGAGIYAAITGKAVYSGELSLKEALEVGGEYAY
ncbi:1-(5-phosphoribosyl)-5-[(5-phosphoribosylamino)methylideneamino]imidazole-4-carboxamide isomerase [Clostridium intestinale]|uniref:1-(5-phosphoribosyl)-5-[(5-phosphoribosylamino)methylideneamino] imidazole-4-carboxamide isomerase n=1 Tax=Clostridium intestinale URNW TaxID=1294142 RepID=U2NLV1_9CLOT|nr:1-(5-phosphoribosyl)-5-[(5-phosphoribosylamino)methylideneamino]imidazole-4-carboxamide isomerase [Clostridium intestinale]ERK29846.1 1-(5-phosphoribosyl)-5-[(5- phosphoribosylamino)methylideneamino] imidazole-4-carboxamide isomerase [Clostridium intestinale URNW]